MLALRSLDTRMELTSKDKFHHQNLERGYEGEVKFDSLIQDLNGERYIIIDLLFEVNNSYFQIDTLLISQDIIHLLDIKNFQGDCYLKSDKLYSVSSGREYKNPINQITRSASLFRQLLQNLNQNYLVDASIIFINPRTLTLPFHRSLSSTPAPMSKIITSFSTNYRNHKKQPSIMCQAVPDPKLIFIDLYSPEG